MRDGLLCKESDLMKDIDHSKGPFMGLEAAGGAPKGGTIELSQGDITDFIACGIFT